MNRRAIAWLLVGLVGCGSAGESRDEPASGLETSRDEAQAPPGGTLVVSGDAVGGG